MSISGNSVVTKGGCRSNYWATLS